MRALLEKGSLTRLMVLRALARGEATTLRRIGQEVGVSVQAISEHLKRLTEAGLVEPTPAGPRLSREGHEQLAASLESLKSYVDTAVRDLAKIETTAARAAEPLSQGDPVGLFMDQGELIARRGSDSPSRGRALQDAEQGQDLLVGDLEGIVALEPGKVTFAVVPDITSGGSRAVELGQAKALLSQADLVVAMGPVARRVCEDAGVTPIRFGGPNAAAEAALVGLDTVVLVEAARLEETQKRYQRACAEWGLGSESTQANVSRKPGA